MMGLVGAIRFTIIEREREREGKEFCRRFLFCVYGIEPIKMMVSRVKADSNSAGEHNQNNLSIAKHQELMSFLEQPRLHGKSHFVVSKWKFHKTNYNIN